MQQLETFLGGLTGRFWKAFRPAQVLILCLVYSSAGAQSEIPAITKVACVGDSITELSGYPDRLAQLLGPNYRVGNFGAGGRTFSRSGDFPYWQSRMFVAGTEFKPDIVILMLGTNDTKPSNQNTSDSELIADYRALALHYLNLKSQPKLYLVLPPRVLQKNAFEISDIPLRGRIVPAIRQVASDLGVPVIDVYTATKGMQDYFPDGVHPNFQGASAIAELVFSQLERK